MLFDSMIVRRIESTAFVITTFGRHLHLGLIISYLGGYVLSYVVIKMLNILF